MKRLIAFSSVAHMGFVMLGIATLTDFGINAAIFGMVAHGLITGMLFFVAGSVQERYDTREMSRLGGLLTQAPKLGWILGFCAMASLGLPGLAGFWGEFPAILSAYDPAARRRPVRRQRRTLWTFRIYMVIAAIGTVLAAGYLLWMLQRVAFGKPKPRVRRRATSTTCTCPSGSRGRRSSLLHRRARHLPEHHLHDHRPRGHAHRRRACRGSMYCVNPHVDFHALAPEIVLTVDDRRRAASPTSSGPSARAGTSSRIASDRRARRADPGASRSRPTAATASMFGGAFVVDNYALAFKGFFLVVAYVTLLLSVDYIGEGDYYQGEFYFLLLTSVLGMIVMASARDLITIFVALETISIPTFVLAGWRKHDTKSNEAAIKYFLIGVLSSAVMLYGMSLIFGDDRLDAAERHRRVRRATTTPTSLFAVAIFLTLVGFAFKVSAVPFHFWAPDTYEGAPTPVTAFLSVASKAGGFVALLTHRRASASSRRRTRGSRSLWVLAAASMTLGNLAALRQTNIVRMLAYSSIAQGGFILVPLAVAGDGSAAPSSFEAVVIYLLIYGAMNLGAFAVVIAVARRTRSAEIESYAGLGQTAPGLAVTMTIFLFSLAGIPPLAGWFAKFVMFRAVLRRRHAVGGRARRHRRGQLGDRVLLLRRGGPARCGSTTRARGRRRAPAARSRSRSPSRSASPTRRSCSSSASTRSSSPASASSRSD